MNCRCGTALKYVNGLVYCPKCGYSMDDETIIRLNEFLELAKMAEDYNHKNPLPEMFKREIHEPKK